MTVKINNAENIMKKWHVKMYIFGIHDETKLQSAILHWHSGKSLEVLCPNTRTQNIGSYSVSAQLCWCDSAGYQITA